MRCSLTEFRHRLEKGARETRLLIGANQLFSRLDSSNSLLSGINKKSLSHLQLGQNAPTQLLYWF